GWSHRRDGRPHRRGAGHAHQRRHRRAGPWPEARERPMTVVTDGGGGAKQRALAVIGAIALIAAAFVARSMIAGGDDDGSGGGGSSSSGEAPVVACTPDLEPLCDALANAGAIAPGTPAVELGSPQATSGTFT